jgi:hypothetical protein
MTINAVIVQLLELSSRQLEQAVSGFNEAQWLHIPAEGLTCASWIVGHAILIDRQVLDELDVPSLPFIPVECSSLYQVRPDDGLGVRRH